VLAINLLNIFLIKQTPHQSDINVPGEFNGVVKSNPVYQHHDLPTNWRKLVYDYLLMNCSLDSGFPMYISCGQTSAQPLRVPFY